MEAPRPETRDGRGTSARPHGGVSAARWEPVTAIRVFGGGSRAAPAAREPWPPTRRSPRRLPQALTRQRHAAVSKTGPDGMRVRIAAISTRRTAARRPLGRGPPDAAGPAAGRPRRTGVPPPGFQPTGRRVAELRHQGRFSVPEFAGLLRVSASTVYRWEAARGPSPSEPVRRTHCRCCTGNSRNARLSDPARSWPERRGRRAVRPPTADPASEICPRRPAADAAPRKGARPPGTGSQSAGQGLAGAGHRVSSGLTSLRAFPAESDTIYDRQRRSSRAVGRLSRAGAGTVPCDRCRGIRSRSTS